MVGRDVPLEDADLGGVEGEAQAFVRNLQHGLDAAAFLVLGLQALIRMFGGARKVHGQAEQQGDADTGAEGEFGQAAPVVVERRLGLDEGDVDPATFDDKGLAHAAVVLQREVAAAARAVVDQPVADADLALVNPAEIETAVVADQAAEQLAVRVFIHDVAPQALGAGDRRVDGVAEAAERQVEGRGNHRIAADGLQAIAGHPQHFCADRIAGVVVVDQVGVTVRGIGLGHHTIGPDECHRHRRMGLGENLTGGGFTQDGIDAVLRPVAGEVVDLSHLLGHDRADAAGQGVDLLTGGDHLTFSFLLVQADPENDGQRRGTHDHGQWQPVRRAVAGVHVFLPGE